MKKESKTDKLIKRYFGISGPLDEFRRSEIGKACTSSLVWTQLILSLACLVAFLVAGYFPEIVGHYFPFIVLFIMLIGGQSAYHKTVDKGVQNDDQEERTPLNVTKKQLRNRAITLAISLPCIFFAYTIFTKSLRQHQNFWTTFLKALSNPKALVLFFTLFFFIGVIFACIYYYLQVDDVRKDTDK